MTILAGLFLVSLVMYLGDDNRYLDYAHDFHKTRFHEEGFADHLQATISGTDISSNERVYRWIAALRMFQDRPLTGFGAGNFYPYYQGYTVAAFATYVSDNPEQSTVHNYFLLVLVEQGIPGAIIFVLLIFVILFKGQDIYLQTKDKLNKAWVMTLMLCMVVVLLNVFLSDLIEAIKVGSFFFIILALLINQDLENTRSKDLAGENGNVIDKV